MSDWHDAAMPEGRRQRSEEWVAPSYLWKVHLGLAALMLLAFVLELVGAGHRSLWTGATASEIAWNSQMPPGRPRPAPTSAKSD